MRLFVELFVTTLLSSHPKKLKIQMNVVSCVGRIASTIRSNAPFRSHNSTWYISIARAMSYRENKYLISCISYASRTSLICLMRFIWIFYGLKLTFFFLKKKQSTPKSLVVAVMACVYNYVVMHVLYTNNTPKHKN